MIDDLGFYMVGTEKFYNKIHAIFRSQQLNVDLTWNFNDKIFEAVDWTIEPTESLDELYKIRAKQIREEYDYVLLFVSGGADSTNMLYAFLKNGIHVDEIVGSAPISGLRDWDSSLVKNDSVENTIEETFLTQIPFLQKIQTDYPQTKVTLHDYFEDMLNYKQDDWLIKGTDWMHPSMAGRYNLDRYLHLKRIAESGKKIAVVQGIDKPQLVRYKDRMALILFDAVYNNKYDSIQHPNTFPVFFYHSPDLPKLMIKQAHVTARYLMRPENKELYEKMPFNYEELMKRPANDRTPVKYNGFNGGVYERGIVPAIYPMIKKISYQAGKPDKMFLGKHDYWFYKHHQGTDIYKMMQSDVKNLIASLDNKFLTFYPNTGLIGLMSLYKSYSIGPVERFVTSNAVILETPTLDPLDEHYKPIIITET
jgi:hypothetical protein